MNSPMSYQGMKFTHDNNIMTVMKLIFNISINKQNKKHLYNYTHVYTKYLYVDMN